MGHVTVMNANLDKAKEMAREVMQKLHVVGE
jgi:hypothetical protein